eukprot:335712-Karenia_brevis.AAC.1
MMREAADILQKIGLEFTFKPSKTSFIGILDGSTRKFSVGASEVRAGEGGKIKILNNIFHHEGHMQAEAVRRTSAMWAAAESVKAQLFAYGVAFEARLHMLRSI